MQNISAGCQRWPEKELTRHLKTLSRLWKISQEDDGCLSPLQGLIHLHITLSALSLSSAPQRQPSLPRCAAVYVESGYDHSWTEAPHLQHEQMRSRFLPTSLTADLFLVCKATSILNHWILESKPAVSGWEAGRHPGEVAITGHTHTHTILSHVGAV